MRETKRRPSAGPWSLLLIAPMFAFGCSAGGGYAGVQASMRNECANRPPSQYEECMAEASVSREDYERERAALREDAARAGGPPP